MPANVELQLIAKILDTGELQAVLDAGITASSFTPRSEAHRAFKYIYPYWRTKDTMGNVPTRDMIEDEIPTIDLPEEDRIKINARIDSMKQFIVREAINTMQVEIEKVVYEDDPRKAIQLVQRYAMELNVIGHSSSDLDVAKDKEDIIAAYEENKFREGLKGMPWPWSTLNEETGGINNAEFTVLYGRPKSMKTWLMLKVATHVYLHANRKVLIYTREMHPRVLRQRLVALMVQAPYKEFIDGRLDELEAAEGGTLEDRFYDLVSTIDIEEDTIEAETGHRKGIIITSDRQDKRGGGVMGLRQKVERYKPDLICVDGVYLMKNDRDGKRSIKWDNITAITQDIHDICLDYNRPVIGTTQANRDSEDKKGEATMRGMAFSDSFAQDCDLGINVIRKPGDDPKEAELAMVVTGARESCLHGFAIHGQPAINFNEVMVPAKNEAGQVIADPRNGEPLVQPLVFYNRSDVMKMFKEVEQKRKQENQAVRSHFASRLADRKERLDNARRGESEEEREGGKPARKARRPSSRRSGGGSTRNRR
jgi:replicative DNA helicase